MNHVEVKKLYIHNWKCWLRKKLFIKEMPSKLQIARWVVNICATTGIAASLVSGCTLHSFAGIGIGEKDVKESVKFLDDVKKSEWRKLEILFIDEISMLDSNYFDLLNDVVKEIRQTDKVFGGVQLIVCGDFFQLPPVSGKYCFITDTWINVNLKL